MFRVGVVCALFFLLHGLFATALAFGVPHGSSGKRGAAYEKTHSGKASQPVADADDEDSDDGLDFDDEIQIARAPELPPAPRLENRPGLFAYLPLFTQTHFEPEIQPPKFLA